MMKIPPTMDVERMLNSELRYRRLFEAARDGILIVDAETRKITDANPLVAELLDHAHEELLGKELWEVGLLRDEEACDTAFQELLQHRYLHSDDLQIRSRTGRQREVEFVSNLYREDGRDVVQCNIRDITDRKQVEQRLQLLDVCIANTTDVVLICEAEPLAKPGPRIVFANQAFERIYGYSLGEVIGRSPRLLQGPKTDPIVLAEIRQALAQRHPIRRPMMNYRKDGTECWMDVDIVPISDAAGKCTHFVAIQRDISESKQVAEQIVEQAALLDQTQDAIVVRDLDGAVSFWNQGAERMYGWTREEVTGQHIGTLIFSEPEQFAEVNRTVMGEGEWAGEIQHVAKDGRKLTIEGRTRLVRDQAGRPKGVLSVNTDITEKKQIQAQFMRAQRMESIGTLAGGIAHDLNNILAPIMMSIEVLQGYSMDPRASKILHTIEVCTQRGADIVRQVLSFARGLEGERVEIQPPQLLKELANIIKDTFPKDIHLQFTVPAATWTILGDPTQVHQILLNLCVNARDAMPNGGELTVSVEDCVLDEQYVAMHMQAKPGRYVKLSVKDSGVGMAPELLEKIFDPFFTTKDVNKGTGLGLSTVLAIVKSHSGIINVHSEQGRGTTIHVYLPTRETAASDRERQAANLQLPQGSGETILVVDDEEAIRDVTSQTLRSFGYQVLTAVDGADAVATYAVHQAEIAAVITDMMMPIMDGGATIRALTRINPAIKIIAASGLDANGSKIKRSVDGLKHFLTKPYTAGTLLKTLRGVLEEA